MAASGAALSFLEAAAADLADLRTACLQLQGAAVSWCMLFPLLPYIAAAPSAAMQVCELPIAMLACTRIGAVHTVVFAGFSADSLGQRAADCKCVLVQSRSMCAVHAIRGLHHLRMHTRIPKLCCCACIWGADIRLYGVMQTQQGCCVLLLLWCAFDAHAL